ncbi:hypothetical protein AWB77_01464 [Caballeronia fortuita]|uniref:Uncharacterized protein n=2 Tax=Caballeronia fortuita TaxID=1777138 RepID=A0A158A7I7_9BURK|nr:hypothetical protein AWB77_01464 [Caballeronia fortuita]
MTKRARLETFNEKALFARLSTAQRTPDAGAYIAEQLWACHRVLSAAGVHNLMYLTRGLVERGIAHLCWEELLDRKFGDPMNVQNRAVWLLFHLCLQAQRDFALDVCTARSREDLLTGRFLEGIKGACAGWTESSSSYLRRVENVLEVCSLDLTVGGGEQETGGDFALILDIKGNPSCAQDFEHSIVTLTEGGPRGDFFVPLIFQAKRYTGSAADISRRNSTQGYQFNRLRQRDCASAYIFYENGDNGIDCPALPMVKLANHCSPVEVSRTTGVFEDSVDFATYILCAVNGCDDMPAAQTREDALNMILANASPESLTKLVVLGNTAGLKETYRDALAALRAEIKSGVSMDATQPERPRKHGPC